ncbi:alpha/beta-hydrolase [Pleurotus eryngii]|uniref:Alpha/beta-hydrolase n=1 Tax=Pleurotus eryngii TaxID=5323 RepID=A0A9P6A151_PLEER|nr:alpha/beta-hydrolase [Pleurotus eryngii]
MPFAFRHQPLKNFLSSWRRPLMPPPQAPLLDSAIPTLPARRPVRGWTLSRILLVKSLSVGVNAMFNTPDLVVGEIEHAAQVNDIHPIKVAGFWYGKRGEYSEVRQAAGPDEKVIYELHGGGFVLGSAGPTGGSAYFCSEALKYAPHDTRVFQVEYRLSQRFPAALIDAMLCYDYVVNTLGFKPSNVMLAGESAGGNLALALARYVVHASITSLSSPGALLLLSPPADWGNTHSGFCSSMHKYSDNDFVHNFLAGYPTCSLIGSLPQSDAYMHLWIAPASLRLDHPESLFVGLPPTLILAGAVGMTLDPMKTLADGMRAYTGTDLVTYVEIANATRAVLLAKWHEPERTQAYEVFASWAKNYLLQVEHATDLYDQHATRWVKLLLGSKPRHLPLPAYKQLEVFVNSSSSLLVFTAPGFPASPCGFLLILASSSSTNQATSSSE